MRRFHFPLALVVLATAAQWLGCNSSTCLDDGSNCADSSDGGPGEGSAVDAGADVVQPPEGCDANAEPKDAPKCVDDGFGVFVDATNGADANAGTKASPVKSITAALGKLGGKPRVYVATGTYAEHVKVTSAVSLYGGFAGGAWSYVGTGTNVAPTDAGYALEVATVASALSIEDVSFTAVAGTDVATSSVASFVHGSPAVTLRRVTLTAGIGHSGKSPTKAADGALMSSTPTAGTLDGNPGNTTNGGLAQLCTCVGGATSKGGGGGNVNSAGDNGETAILPPNPSTATGAGQSVLDCLNGTNAARAGSNAETAAAAAGAATLGTLTEAGWSPSGGSKGVYGAAGQGGGGGGGSAGGGGSGACGGCGGAGGDLGEGGGASIALLTLDSAVKVIASTLTTSDAGTGGAGGVGGAGLAGGTKGTQGGGACPGGNGGKGANGTDGGGGAGGISIGVLSKGAAPTIDAVITTGARGAPGNGAIEGQKADTLALQ